MAPLRLALLPTAATALLLAPWLSPSSAPPLRATARRCAHARLQQFNTEMEMPDGWDERMKQNYMREVQDGTEGGGWDNEEYLEATKIRPKTSNAELLKQSMAYIATLEAKGQPPRKEVIKEIEDLKANMTAEEVQMVTDSFAAEQQERTLAEERRTLESQLPHTLPS